jgi:uncharacterized protein (DUF1697 family)
MQKQTYIALLRGINVGGHKLIKMENLRALCESLGLEQVQTYIQSGNILFQTAPMATSLLAQRLRQAIQNEFGFEVPCLVKTLDAWAAILQNNPFLANVQNAEHLHFTFLENPAATPDFIKGEFGNDTYAFSSEGVYLNCPDGYHKTKLTNNFIEKSAHQTASTRNWKTVCAIWELCKRI